MSGRSCNRCGVTKPTSEFYGGENRCKVCSRARKAETYARRKAGDLPTVTVLAAICPDCQIEKPIDQFNVDHHRPTGRKLYCRSCVVIRYRKTRYGITEEQRLSMAAAQGGVCAICRRLPPVNRKPLVVDHDHGTGVVRGLLCDDCNVGIARLQEDPEFLLAAASYLRRSRLAVI